MDRLGNEAWPPCWENGEKPPESYRVLYHHPYARCLQLHAWNKPCTLQQTMYTTVHNVAAMLQPQFMLHVMPLPTLHVLHLYISTLCAATNMAVFCSSLISRFPVCRSGILWMTFRWFQWPPLLLVSFCFHIPHVLYFYCKVLMFRIFSAPLLITILSPQILTSIYMFPLHYHRLWRPVCVRIGSVGSHCWYHNTVTVPSLLVCTAVGTWPHCRYMVTL